ncbi:MAG: hypothetical protein MJY70_04950 [Bacteroidales bacterium]|nr:hypothetical protein [Bacteroidales bacterium]
MKRIFLPLLALAAILTVSCEDTLKIEEGPIDPKVDVTLDGESVIDGNINVEYELSVRLNFTCSGVSMVKAEMPEGWRSTTSMTNKTIDIYAPAYSDLSAVQSGDVTIKAYDGTGSFITKAIHVSAFECKPGCSIVSPDITNVVKFTLGSKIWFVCDMTANIGDFNFTLPKGWTAERTETGFAVCAPVYTPESGDEQDGTVDIVPVTWFGAVCDDLKMSLMVHVDEKATFQFSDPGNKTFSFGQTQEIPMLCSGVQSIDSFTAPEGWTVDYSRLLSDGIVSVTAPAKESMVSGRGALVFTATQTGITKSITSEGTLILRIQGINDADDILEFNVLYGNSSDTPDTDYTKMEPYMVNGELSLNADITIPSEALVYGAYWIKKLRFPLNGNNHTLTIATRQEERGGLFQNLGADVRDLKIAGTMECTGGAGKYIRMGSLAGYVSADGVTISNVTSTVDIKANNNTNGETMYIGGIIGLYDAAISKPVTVRFENCQFNGTITTTKSVESLGGILGQAQQGSETYITNCSSSAVITCTARGIKGVGGIVGSGGVTTNPGEIVYLTGCSYTGTINYASDGNYDTRIGGILGNLERGAELTGCSFTGTINADMKGKAYLAGSTTRGIGGMIGRDTAPNSGYPKMNAKAILTDCVSNGRISITNSGDSESDNKSHVGQIVGLQKNTSASHVETNCTANSTITFSYIQ